MTNSRFTLNTSYVSNMTQQLKPVSVTYAGCRLVLKREKRNPLQVNYIHLCGHSLIHWEGINKLTPKKERQNIQLRFIYMWPNIQKKTDPQRKSITACGNRYGLQCMKVTVRGSPLEYDYVH